MPSPIPAPFLQALRLLIRANHILHQQGLVDAFGHISIRHPMDKSQYLIAAYDPGAPALVKSRSDFIAYWIADSSPVDASAPQGYSERFIHGAVFKKFPHANCVVHSHSEAVIPFTLGRHGVKPVFHMAGFMGADWCPMFRAGEAYSSMREFEPDMLVKNQALGTALADKMSDEQPVVLQHKHGFTTFGGSVEEAIYRAVYTQTNCKLLAQALAVENLDWERVAFLTREEARACRVMNEKCQDKSFRLWLREVQVNPLFENEEGEPEKGEVAGMKMRKHKSRSSAHKSKVLKEMEEPEPPMPVPETVAHTAELPVLTAKPSASTIQPATHRTTLSSYPPTPLVQPSRPVLRPSYQLTQTRNPSFYKSAPSKGHCVDCGVYVP
ncbi:hypothetical protein HBI56_100210 [Parastagonospora nodorum]|nr:hypothetical protein HBI10_023880 [Parastagonospora nodorum]KAH4012052.1 hypothetical protein HBI13_194240 [Parastagonospora nodorum]KAH4038984.1 hypothetical protein HBI09_042300 [Parastagonospora nodorum]KAH4054760.1 hypothetical protein HBH49_066840 [Parastagonospora nodorum]KAH4212597.1 hypothetical protein HBI95_039540 [Parastagonospora nodorum]